jgi:hypothetical protein
LAGGVPLSVPPEVFSVLTTALLSDDPLPESSALAKATGKRTESATTDDKRTNLFIDIDELIIK